MKTLFTLIFAVVVLLGTVSAQGKKGTPAEAEALVKKAVAFYKTNGQEKAFAELGSCHCRRISCRIIPDRIRHRHPLPIVHPLRAFL